MDFVFEFAVESLLIGILTALLLVPVVAGLYLIKEYYLKIGVPILIFVLTFWFVCYHYIRVLVV